MSHPRRPALDTTFSTSFDSRFILPMLQLPKGDPSQLITADIGAGGSNLTATLRNIGYDAHAIDPRYDQDFRSLLESIKAQLGVAPDNHLPQGIKRVVRDWFLRNLGGNNGRNQYALEQMLDDAREHPNRYRQAYADKLPFIDGEVDFTYSLEAVSAFLMDSVAHLNAAVREMIRVTTPGGIIQITPWIHTSQREERLFSRSQWANARMVTREIRKKVGFLNIMPDPHFQASLMIIK